jgi:protein arginine kinase activator
MQYCTACQKAIANIVIMDLQGGAVTGSQHLCTACAEQLGVSQPKLPLKFSAEILEDLLDALPDPLAAALKGIPGAGTESFQGGAQGSAAKPGPARPRLTACPGCGLTPADFRAKNRLGCPRCYETYRPELLALLGRIHEAHRHSGRLPGRSAPETAAPDEQILAQLRRKLEDAVRGERYEEAASLRDDLRRAERGEGARP